MSARHWALLCAAVGAALPPAKPLRRLLLAHLRYRGTALHAGEEGKFARRAEQVRTLYSVPRLIQKHLYRCMTSNRQRIRNKCESVVASPIESHCKSLKDSPIENHCESVVASQVKNFCESMIASPVKNRCESMVASPIKNRCESVTVSPVKINCEAMEASPVKSHCTFMVASPVKNHCEPMAASRYDNSKSKNILKSTHNINGLPTRFCSEDSVEGKIMVQEKTQQFIEEVFI